MAESGTESKILAEVGLGLVISSEGPPAWPPYEPLSMHSVFICYRREDTEGYAGRLYESLKARLPDLPVFMDVDDVAPGEDFVAALDRTLSSCDTLLALIGRTWLSAADAAGRRRIEKDDDFVRAEIATALERGIRFIPILVQDATMPTAGDLPASLKGLARRQASALRHSRWADDIARIAEVLQPAERGRADASAESPSRSSRSTAASHLFKIGRYEIHGVIERGTLSELYRALDPDLHRWVAIKVLAAPVELDREVQRRFLVELRAAAGLVHPNIAAIYDVGQYEGRTYAAMEFVDGESLAGFIARGAPVALTRRLAIAEGICAGLAYAHGRGVAHGELKPSSVVLGTNGEVKLLNFGLSQRATLSGAGGMTMIIGTPHFEAPERLMGGPVDHRADIFSFGVLLYELVSYRKPFTSNNPYELWTAIVRDEPPPLRSFVPELDEELEQVIRAAMAKDPKARPQDIGQLGAALGRIRARLEASA